MSKTDRLQSLHNQCAHLDKIERVVSERLNEHLIKNSMFDHSQRTEINILQKLF